MKRTRILLAILFFFAGTWLLSKDHPHFEVDVYTPDRPICMTRYNDSLWIGMNNGILQHNLYTGEEKIMPGGTQDCPLTLVNALTVTTDGQIWAGGAGGLASYNGQTWKLWNSLGSDMANNTVTNIVEDQQNRVWWTTIDGNVGILNPVTGKLEACLQEKLGIVGKHCLVVDDQGIGYIGTQTTGLFRFDGKTLQHVSTRANPDVIFEMLCSVAYCQGEVWFATTGGIWKLHQGVTQATEVRVSNDVVGFELDLYCDAYGKLWAATMEDVYCYDGKEWEAFPRASLHIGAPSLYVDAQSTVWVLSAPVRQHGFSLERYADGAWKTVSILSNTISGTVAISTLEHMTEVVSTQRFDNLTLSLPSDRSVPFTFKHVKLADSLAAIIPENDSVYWDIYGDLYRYQNNKSLCYNSENSPLPQTPHASINDLKIDARGHKWIATSRALFEFDDHTWKRYERANCGIANNNVSTLQFDRNGTLWVGTEYGLCTFNGQTWRNFNNEDCPVARHVIKQLLIDASGIVWVADKSKLYRYDGVRWEKIKFRTPLIHNPLIDYDINKLFIDRKNRVWCFCSGLIILIDGDQQYSYLLNRDLNRPFFEERDGVFWCYDESGPIDNMQVMERNQLFPTEWLIAVREIQP